MTHTRNHSPATWCAALLFAGFLIQFAPTPSFACQGGGGGSGGGRGGGGSGGGGAGGAAMAMGGGRGGGPGGMMSSGGGAGGMMSGMCGGGMNSQGGGTTMGAQSAMAFQARAAQAFQAGAANHRARVALQRQQIQLINLKNQRLHALRQSVNSRNEGEFERLKPGRAGMSEQTTFASIGSTSLTRSEVLQARRTAYSSEMHRRRGN